MVDLGSWFFFSFSVSIPILPLLLTVCKVQWFYSSYIIFPKQLLTRGLSLICVIHLYCWYAYVHIVEEQEKIDDSNESSSKIAGVMCRWMVRLHMLGIDFHFCRSCLGEICIGAPLRTWMVAVPIFGHYVVHGFTAFLLILGLKERISWIGNQEHHP